MESQAEHSRPLIGFIAVRIRWKVPELLPRNENLSGVVDDPLDAVKEDRFLENINEKN